MVSSSMIENIRKILSNLTKENMVDYEFRQKKLLEMFEMSNKALLEYQTQTERVQANYDYIRTKRKRQSETPDDSESIIQSSSSSSDST
jgi:hypothetical protein